MSNFIDVGLRIVGGISFGLIAVGIVIIVFDTLRLNWTLPARVQELERRVEKLEFIDE